MRCPKCFNEMYYSPDSLSYNCKNCDTHFKYIASTPTRDELNDVGIEIKNCEKLKIAVICDSRQDFNSYIMSHNDEKYEYIYVSDNSYPHGIEFDDVIDLRAVTQMIMTRMKPKGLNKHIYYTIVNKNGLPIGFCIKTNPHVYASPLFEEHRKNDAIEFLKSIKPKNNKLAKIEITIMEEENEN